MDARINGLHHVTATAGDAQEDVDFYTKTLGLRLVKRTVNFDNPGVYHFYYGTTVGAPGTIMTTFPYKGQGVRIGEKGAGQITVTSFSVPDGSIGFWKERLTRQGLEIEERRKRFGESAIAFEDPSGLILELVAVENDQRDPWLSDGIGPDDAIRGVHSVTMVVNRLDPTRQLLVDVVGFDVIAEETRRTRFGVGGGGAGRMLDVIHIEEASRAVNGIGTVHHVAFAVSTGEEQQEMQEELRRLGYNVTDVRDRQYFRSIYFREPGGILFEIATEGPGFLADEDENELGQNLRLPPWEESRRQEIEAALPEIDV